MSKGVVATRIHYTYERLDTSNHGRKSEHAVIDLTYLSQPDTADGLFLVLSINGKAVDVLPCNKDSTAIGAGLHWTSIPKGLDHQENRSTHTIVFELEEEDAFTTWLIYTNPKGSPNLPSWDQIFDRI